MESNVEDQNTPAASEETPAPRRRASRRVSAAAGATAEAAAVLAAPAAETPAPETTVAPAAEAPAVEAAVAEAPVAEAEAAPKKRATRSRKKAEPAEAPAAEGTEAPAADTAVAAEAEAAPKKRATRSRKKAEPVEVAVAESTEVPAADATTTEAPAAEAPVEAPAEPVKRTRSRRAKTEPTDAAAASASTDQAPAAQAETAVDASATAAQGETAAAGAAQADAVKPDADAAKSDAAGESEKPNRNRRARGRGAKAETSEAAEQTEQDTDSEESGRGRGQSQNGEKNRQNNGQNGQNNGQNGQGSQNGPADKNGAENSSRSSRTRQRDRKRRGSGDDLEPELTEDDVLLPIAGILDVLDNYAFVRTSGYLPGTSDVYVSLGQVKKYGLRRGDAVVGAIRQPREGESGSRQKYNAIVKIDAVNGRTLEETENRVEAADLTPIYPDTRLRLEGTPTAALGRAIDLVAPIGLGQRGLIVLPARTAGAPILTELAEAVRANAPEAHLMLVLADAQPEDVTHLERTVRGEVVAASFDRPAEDQATVAELSIERAKRMLELGHDVVVLIDSLNRFARAYAQAQHGQARPAHDEIDEFALGQIMKLLAAARNVENGGSLTILATAQHGTGLPADQTLLREARRVANSEIRIGKTRAGVAPIVTLAKSRTANTTAMLSADEANVLGLLREALQDDDAEHKLTKRIRETASNAALLAEVQRAGGLS